MSLSSTVVKSLGSEYVNPVKKSPYEKLLLREEVEKINKLQEKLSRKLDDSMLLWIRDCGDFEKKENGKRSPFFLRIRTTTPIGEIRDMIRKKYIELGYIEENAREGPLRLVFSGRTLEDGKKLSDYSITSKISTWPNPYRGIIWVVPFHIEPNYEKMWGSAIDDAERL